MIQPWFCCICVLPETRELQGKSVSHFGKRVNAELVKKKKKKKESLRGAVTHHEAFLIGINAISRLINIIFLSLFKIEI